MLKNETYLKSNKSNNSAVIMMYMCGSNLESELGVASSDIDEILKSDFENIIIQTGGSLKWHKDGMKGIQRYYIKDHSQKLIENLNSGILLSSEMLADFIKFSAQKYPSDRYILLLWNHGGGAVLGFGYDETNPFSALTIDMIDKALSDTRIRFDFIGIDACIMGNIETAFMLGKYADYMVASEEAVVTAGWYYTDFLNMLLNPNVSTYEVGKKIVDDYIKKSSSEKKVSPTLSLINLKLLNKQGYSLYSNFFAYETRIIRSGRKIQIKSIRSKCKNIYMNEYGHIDLIDFLKRNIRINPYAKPFMEMIQKAVMYSGGSREYGGLSIYFPEKYSHETDKMVRIYRNMNFGKEYIEFISEYFGKSLI